jgi:glycosyltransferase involved in cell wall biosynthesis
MKNLTLIIPAKNESASLPKVLNEVKDYECNIIVILESLDIGTINAIKNLNCKIIHQTGKGYGNALIEGMNNVETEYLCIFNADGSFDPKYLNQMLNACKNNLDFIFASRYMNC